MKRIFYVPAVSQMAADAKVQAGCGYTERGQAEKHLAEIKASADQLSVYRCEVHPRVDSITLHCHQYVEPHHLPLGGGKVRKVAGRKQAAKPSYEWTCPRCRTFNHDTRKSFVICVGCGMSYERIPDVLA